MYRYLFMALIFVSRPSSADALEAVPDVPEMPLPVANGESMEADITITRKGNKTIHEYSVNGQVYKIKIIPDIGPAYYFIDLDGDGEMEEVQEEDYDVGTKVNQWTIFSW